MYNKRNFCCEIKADSLHQAVKNLIFNWMFFTFKADKILFVQENRVGLQSIFFYWRYNPLWVCILQSSSGDIASSRRRFLDHTQRNTTVRRTSLDEWSVRRRDLYLTTHNTHNRQTSMPSVGFEPTISAGERP